MRLIDGDKLKELYTGAEGLSVPCEVILANIDDMPTIDAEPVVHGKWIHYDIDGKITEEDAGNIWYSKCSNCSLEVSSKSLEKPVCPECGAKMDL